ncbi:serine acetyltransferase 5-like [Carica papaya]|uniref:serine acetyltransferase 5-like n=1 Tax=Carica papaya TaxID=3649 RepID=UPI000B8CC6E3|nr:serine acetyltransferase 5-like [Carica papaya]
MPAGEIHYPSPPSSATEISSADGANEDEAFVWSQIKAEARRDAESEPALASYLYSTILSHSSLERSLAFHLGNKLCSSTLLSTLLYDLFLNSFSSDPEIRAATVADLRAARMRDPACVSFSHCLLNYKGFLACQVLLFNTTIDASLSSYSLAEISICNCSMINCYCYLKS